jgi:hypothetical protein
MRWDRCLGYCGYFSEDLNRRLSRDLPDSDPGPLASSGAQAKRLKVNHARGLGLGRKNLFTAFIVDRAWATKFPEPVRHAEHASMRRHGSARFTRRARRGPITKDSSSMVRLISGPAEKFLDGESGDGYQHANSDTGGVDANNTIAP